MLISSSRLAGLMAGAALVAALTAGCSSSDGSLLAPSGTGTAPPSTSPAEITPSSAVSPSASGSPGSTNPPVVQSSSLLRPSFKTSEGTTSGGTSWTTTWTDGRTIMVTAQHLFGTAVGMTKDYTGSEMKANIFATRATGMDGGSSITSKQLLIIPDADGSPDTRDKDVAGFVIGTPGTIQPYPIAQTDPADGTPVWLYAEPRSGGGPQLYPGTVAVDDSVPTGTTLVVYGPGGIAESEMPGTSGGPVLNSAGEVVGMLSGGGDNGNGEVISIGPSATSIRRQLTEGLATS